jgi:PKD repeat protein
MGSVVSSTGVVGPAFAISDAAGAPLGGPVQRSTVAFDGASFLVVWADNRPAGAGIRGALVSPQGAVVNGADFLIAPIARTNDLAPQCSSGGGSFFVAWQDNALSSAVASQLFMARVSSAGVAGAVAALPLAEGQSQTLEYLVPGPGGETLIVLQDVAAVPNVTLALRVAADDSPLGPAGGMLLFKHDFGVSGFGVPVGAIFDGTEYSVLSSLGADIDSSVFKTRIKTDGTVIRPSAPFAEVGQGSTNLAENAFPRTSYNGNGEFLFVRNDQVSDTAYHLLTKRVTLDGTDRDPNMQFIDTASQGVLNGAMAAGIGTGYLVVWMDGRRAGAQPDRQLNVYGVLLDGAKPGDDSKPVTKAVARASPTIGTSPLKVQVWAAGSTGIVDYVRWDFGDGTYDIVASAIHTYSASGEYIAVLSLVHAGFALRDYVRISVDMDQFGGGGGPPQAIAGTPGPVSNGVNTDVAANNLTVAVNFATANSDTLRLSGYFDPAVLPVLVTDKTGALTIFGRTYSFTTTINGTFVSGTSAPVVHFSLNRYNGYFVFTATAENLRDALAALGAGNETVAKPGKEIVVPFSLNYAGLALDSTVTGLYTATAAKSGKLLYAFGSSGCAGMGVFRIFNAAALEAGKKTQPRTHSFSVQGSLGWGGNVPVAKADSGNWRITLGNYVEDIPVGSLTLSNDVYSYRPGNVKTGITQFVYNTKSRGFGVAYKGVAAEGDNPSGMPLATSTFWRVDVAFSVDLDLADGSKFQGSGYARMARKKLTAKKWLQR